MSLREIASLDQCPNLRHLNLSRNQITKIKGLEACTSLAYLSLAYNQIVVVEGLAQCTELKRFDLTANRVASITGLSHIQALPALTHVSFQTFGLTDANPVCQTASYRSEVLALVPKLKSLDGHRRNAQVMMSMSDLDAYDINPASFQAKLDPKPWVQDSSGPEQKVTFADPEFTSTVSELKKMLQKGDKILQSLQ